MANFPSVSVIVPSRNRGKLLEACLDGIKKQSLDDFEVLILDDGSSLTSRNAVEQLLKNYDERFIFHCIHAPDTKGSGPSFVRNQGIALAKGEYLAFCDDDDFWCRDDYLEVAVSALKQEDADICFSGIKIVNAEGRTVVEKMMQHVELGLQAEQKLELADIYSINREQILCYPDYAHLNITIARKALADRIGGFWAFSNYAEDVGFFIQLCDQAGTILFRPEACAVHNAPEQRDDESISNRMRLQDKRLLEINVYQRLLMNCKETAALNYVKKSLANTLKMTTEELKAEGNVAVAAGFARMAWGIYPTIKWGLYSLWLSVRCK